MQSGQLHGSNHCKDFSMVHNQRHIVNTIRMIDDIIEENSLLKHKFYRMWSDGQLDRDALVGYSKEYYQMVKAVPIFMESILSRSTFNDTLNANMQEEYDHIPLWEDFAVGLGTDRDELVSHEGREETHRAVDAMHGLMDRYHEGAAAMYALEKEIPKISVTKMDGLEKFYGIDDDNTIRYFVQHAEADVRHAAEWREILKSGSEHDALIYSAQASMDAQNLLLDGCLAYCDNN